MTIKETLIETLNNALRERNNLVRDTLRITMSSIKQLEKDSGNDLGDLEVIGVLQKEIRTREETINEAKKANRPAMIEELSSQIEIIKEFLPKELADEQLRTIIGSIISNLDAKSMKDMGKVMQETISQTAGAATNDRISRIAREFLQN